MSSANKAAEKVEQRTGEILGETDSPASGKAGAYCTDDSQCSSGTCDSFTRKCL